MPYIKKYLSHGSACWLILVLALLSTGCQTANSFGKEKSIVSGDSIVVEPAHTAAQHSAIEIRVSEHGVGGVTKNTLFNKEGLEDALPGLEIVEEMLATEDQQYPILKAYHKGEPVLTIIPNQSTKKVYSVWVSSNRVGNALGDRLGTRFETIYAPGKPANCQAGMEEYSGRVICTAPAGKHIKYLFEGHWNGPDGELPPVKVMALWLLTRIIWVPSIH